jgi:hypothetical protein
MTATELLEAPAPATIIEPEIQAEALRPEIVKVLPPMPETANIDPVRALFLAGVRRISDRLFGQKPGEVNVSGAADEIAAETPTDQTDAPVKMANPIDFIERRKRQEALRASVAQKATEAVVEAPEVTTDEQAAAEAEADVVHLPSSGKTKSGLAMRVRGDASEFVSAANTDPEETPLTTEETPALSLVETPAEATEATEVTEATPSEPIIGKRRRLDVPAYKEGDEDASSLANPEINTRSHALGVPEGATGRHRGLQGAPYDAEGKLNNYPEFPQPAGKHKLVPNSDEAITPVAPELEGYQPQHQ